MTMNVASLTFLLLASSASSVKALQIIPESPWFVPDEQYLLGDALPSGPNPFPLQREAAADSPLECLQVSLPVLGPSGPVSAAQGRGDHPSDVDLCSQVLMQHTFSFSYGKPFVGHYTPPGCNFDRVIMNFTVTSSGRQFDRLGLMFFGDTEVWRTSTAEPTPSPGIVWTHIKDMTPYLSLWRSPQKLIFDLGNLVNDRYTGSFNCTLTATFFKQRGQERPDDTQMDRPADVIIPVSAGKAALNQSSAWRVPEQKADQVIRFPRNAYRAVFTISANGQQAEEFWWSNVMQTDANRFNKTIGELPAMSPFREIQVLIDGHLAGVAWPFPVIFTGGVSPGLHRPVVGLDAFDLQEYEVDISPWLGLLCNGDKHTISIKVMGLGEDANVLTEDIGQYWVVTGKIFVWVDKQNEGYTTGTLPTVDTVRTPGEHVSELRQNASGINEELFYHLYIMRFHEVSGEIRTPAGLVHMSSGQRLRYLQMGRITAFGANQVNDVLTTGNEQSQQGPRRQAADFSYPLFANQTVFVSPTKNLTIDAKLDQGFKREVSGHRVFPSGNEAFGGEKCVNDEDVEIGCEVSTMRSGEAKFLQSGDKRHSSGFGSTTQELSFSRQRYEMDHHLGREQVYSRNISAINGTIVYDHEVLGQTDLNSYTAASKPALAGENYMGAEFAPICRYEAHDNS